MVDLTKEEQAVAAQLLAEIATLPRQQRRARMREFAFLGVSADCPADTRKLRREVAKRLVKDCH